MQLCGDCRKALAGLFWTLLEMMEPATAIE